MVGIVLVSHSAEIAAGTAALARQMGGDAPLATAGGTDDPDNPIGTDAMKVLAAIEEVWSDDGVVVLMDLGSAILSADFALDMLEDDRRAKVVLCEAPLVEGAVAAATAAGAGLPLEAVLAEARSALVPKAANLGLDLATPPPDEPAAAPKEGPSLSAVLPVDNPSGLHARPAARFVSTVAGHDTAVTVTNLTTGAGPVRGDSFSAIGTLGARQGHQIEVTATGDDAAAVLAALGELAASGYGDTAGAAPPPPAPRGAGPVGASPGTAVGPVRHLVAAEVPTIDPRPVGEPAAERDRLAAAKAQARREIEHSRAVTRSVAGEAEAGIFDAHLLLLDDTELAAAVDADIGAGHGAFRAWSEAIAALAQRFSSLDDAYQRERAADVEAVGRQVRAALLGIDVAPEPSAEGILVADDLDPGATARLDSSTVHGIVTAAGGPTSHSAILARSLGIPAVVAAGPDVLAIPEGTTVIVDGTRGTLTVDPDETALAAARAAVTAETEATERAAASAREPAVTADGVTIEVAANIGRPEEATAAASAGADGVGLFRSEFLFLGRDTAPDAAEQEAAYRSAAEALQGRRLVLRTLDVGGDKPLAFAAMPAAANPFLGVRGLRLGLHDSTLLSPQLDAVVRVAADHPVSVMFPMVTTVAEVHRVRALVSEAVERTGATPSADFEVGVMIEVPAAAVLADRLAPHVDFFSVGTNALTQYVMAAERGSPDLAAFADALHPALLRLVAQVADAGRDQGIWVGVCGEAAGDPDAVPILVGLGVTELSVAPPLVPAVKQAVRALDSSAAQALAQDALDLDDAASVRALVRGSTSI